MNKILIGIVIVLILVGGCGKPADSGPRSIDVTRVLSGDDYIYINSKDEPVLLVAGEEITSDDIINKPAEYKGKFIVPGKDFIPIAQSMGIHDFRETLTDTMLYILGDSISDILLYKSAKKEYGDNLDELIQKSVDGEISKIVQQCEGDEVKADEVIKQKWHDRETYKNLVKREILKQWYFSMQQENVGFIPYRQLIRKYDSMKDENFVIEPEIQFSSIDIIPSRLSVPDPNLSQREYAEKLADEIYSKLKSGEAFEELAKEYSQGPKKTFGGLWDKVNPKSLAKPFDAIANAAMQMNQGDISEPIKTDTHIFIIRLEYIKPSGYKPFEEVQQEVRKALIEDKNKATAMSQLEENINQQMGRYETTAFIDFCLEKIHKDSNQE